MTAQYDDLGIVHHTRSDLDKAIEYLQKSLDLNQELGNKEGMASDYSNLGTVYAPLFG